MQKLRIRAKRHVSVTANIIRVRELPPAEIGYDVQNEQDLQRLHVSKGPMPTDEELADLMARAIKNRQNMKVYLPLVADGLVRQNVGARRFG